MTTFTPTSIAMEPVDRPDYLAGAVLQSLSRPAGRWMVRSRRQWGRWGAMFRKAIKPDRR